MNPELFRETIAHAGLAAVGIAFLAGLAFSFNPVSMAAIPVSLAYVTKARESKEAAVFAAMFMLGMVVTHTTRLARSALSLARKPVRFS